MNLYRRSCQKIYKVSRLRWNEREPPYMNTYGSTFPKNTWGGRGEKKRNTTLKNLLVHEKINFYKVQNVPIPT